MPSRFLLPKVLAATGVAALAFVAYQHETRRHDELSALTRELAQTHAALDRANVSPSMAGAPGTPVFVTQAMDPAAADAIAGRVAAMMSAREKEKAAFDEAVNSPTPAQLTARDGAQRTLDAAIVHGHLTRDDVLAMRSQLANDPAGAAETSRLVAVAINLGKVVPDDPQFVFP